MSHGPARYYYKARMYSPELGRFLQTDPIGYQDQQNLYAYVGNDPVNLVDPSGEIIETVIDVASLAVGIKSFVDNVNDGNVGGAVVDAVGIVVDGVAVALPFVPGGAALGIKAARNADKVVGAVNDAKSASKSVDLQKQLASESQLSQLVEGGGTVISQPAKQADRVAAQVGGSPADIQKVSSDAFTAKDGQTIQTHAFRDSATNQIIEPKTIIDERR